MASKKETAKPKLASLTVDQKQLEILDQIGKKSYTLLCEEYGVCRATISNIRKKESELRARFACLGEKLFLIQMHKANR